MPPVRSRRRGWQIDGGKTPLSLFPLGRNLGIWNDPFSAAVWLCDFPFEDTPMTRANRGRRVSIFQIKFYDPFL
jgi:hypothetical protein